MIAVLSPNGPTVTHLSSKPGRLAVATLRGVGLLEREGESNSWRSVGIELPDSHISALVAVPGGLMAAAHSGGVFFSPDGFEWERRDAGITCEHVFCLHAQETRNGLRLYAGTQPASLFSSSDLGQSWMELPAIGAVPGTDKWTFPPPPHDAHTKSLTFVPDDDDIIYACIEQGALLRSDDAGRSWRELDSYYNPSDRWYRDIHRVIVSPIDPDRLIMTTGMGLYRSWDGGESWTKLTGFDFRIGYPDHIIQSPLDDRTLFLSGSSEDPSSWRGSHRANPSVMVSRDFGDTWQESMSGLPLNGRPNFEAMNMAVWPGGFLLFIGNTDGEVYCSEDSARTWRLIGKGFAPVSKVGHYRHLQEHRS